VLQLLVSLHKYGLENDFKMNIAGEPRHIGKHTFQHEIEVAAKAGMLGSLDANEVISKRMGYRSNSQIVHSRNYWKQCFSLKAGGLQGGGVNFDAKIEEINRYGRYPCAHWWC
jgi:xylose isomerase